MIKKEDFMMSLAYIITIKESLKLLPISKETTETITKKKTLNSKIKLTKIFKKVLTNLIVAIILKANLSVISIARTN